MDPTACYQRLIDAIERGCTHAARLRPASSEPCERMPRAMPTLAALGPGRERSPADRLDH